MSSELQRIDNIQLVRHRMNLGRPCLPVRSLRHSAGYVTVDPEKQTRTVICYECGEEAEMSKTGIKQWDKKLGEHAEALTHNQHRR